MRKHLRILSFVLLLSLMGAMTACHSSKKTVKGSGGTVVRTVDYSEMRAEMKSRHYDVPMIGALISEVTAWVGVPYKYAGNDKKGVDCSGLISQVFLKVL
ncbi:MAG: NlpC/P60 family protein, partial [Bacteroides sp.]|nr:NlpC/P60 family protein [Bacteroides sp.]